MTQLADRGDLDADVTQPPRAGTVVVTHHAGTGAVRPRAVSAWTLDDRIALGGSGVASLCLTWLLFEQVLPLSGRTGFFLMWFVVFVALYAAVTALRQPGPVVVDRIVASLVFIGAAVVVTVVVWTIAYTFYRGWGAYRRLNFYTQDGGSSGPLASLDHGGVREAIVGSGIELGIAVLISLPLGLATAVFMCEIGGRFARVVRTVVEAMTALPDLIAGLFVYTVLIIGLGEQRTGVAAALALSITMLPIIARSSEVVLRVVPGGLREAGLALGSSRLRTVWNVVLPTAKSGLATALILGMARGIGESAPLLIVSANNTYLNADPFHDPMNSLPLVAITDLRAPDIGSTIARGYGAASVLMFIVAVLFVTVRLLTRHRGARS